MDIKELKILVENAKEPNLEHLTNLSGEMLRKNSNGGIYLSPECVAKLVLRNTETLHTEKLDFYSKVFIKLSSFLWELLLIKRKIKRYIKNGN